MPASQERSNMPVTFKIIFDIPGAGEYAVEDYAQGGEHLMPNHEERFMIWKDGSHIGSAETAQEAYNAIADAAMELLEYNRDDCIETLSAIQSSINLLSESLGHFKQEGG
jgi:hypothetical protein